MDHLPAGACSRWLIFALFLFAANVVANAQRESVIYSFTGTKGDGAVPYTELTTDKAGNLYGTTTDGGLASGVVYELSPPVSPDTNWTETVLVEFGVSNGDDPEGPLTIDAAGNLYGTTTFGGSSPNCQGGCGIVYELSPPAAPGGEWTQTVLYSFSGQDGQEPYAGVVVDRFGNLYGATRMGGESASGVVFEVSPPSSPGGAWSERSLYEFSGQGDGGDPLGTLVFDAVGNLYGTTRLGGTFGLGTAFELVLAGPGQYTEKVLHSFGGGADGSDVVSGLLLLKSGVLAGTAQLGGAHAGGMAFALTPPAQQGGEWIYTDLHDFGAFKNDGTNPQASLTLGNRVLYGTTAQGGSSGSGTVFALMPTDGVWIEKVLYYFGGPLGTNGAVPHAAVLIHDGALFGAAEEGGECEICGVVYELLLPTVPEPPQ
jgi:uncharacterized repeat protein (TIGR03803 family)